LLVIALQDVRAAQDHTLLVFGDSLSAAYGLRPEQGWVALLEKRLQTQGYGYHIVNASISGETSSGGLARLPRALALNKPTVVILELGANDGLRGLPIATTQANLSRMLELVRQSGAKALLLGIRLPPNYGPRYGSEFAAMYGKVAGERGVAVVPFLLERVALNQELMQADGLHPTEAGEPPVLDTVWPFLLPLLERR
jgi:acyl-CoA thioesterase-1